MTDDAQARIADMVSSNDVLLFMKGSPLFPQCGFSSKAVAILDHLGVEYASVDVLQDMEIRRPDLEDVFLQVMSGTSASNISLSEVAL